MVLYFFIKPKCSGVVIFTTPLSNDLQLWFLTLKDHLRNITVFLRKINVTWVWPIIEMILNKYDGAITITLH